MAKKSIFDGFTRHSDFSNQKFTPENTLASRIMTGVSTVTPVSRQGKSVKINATGQSLSFDNQKLLLKYIFEAMYPHVRERDRLIPRYNRISTDLAAVSCNVELEEERERRHAQGLSTALPNQRYPLTQGHVDDVVTHLLQILFPARQMYGAVELDPDEQNISAAFVAILNVHGDQFSHYKEYGKMLHDAVAFNHSGLEINWSTKMGWLQHRRTASGAQGSTDILQSGNRIVTQDLYNTIWDYDANPADYATEAQVHVKVERMSVYQLMKAIADQKMFGPAEMTKQLRQVVFSEVKPAVHDSNLPFYDEYAQSLFGGMYSTGYKGDIDNGLYKQRPAIRSNFYWDDGDGAHGQTTNDAFDYNKYNGNNTLNQRKYMNSANELLKCYIRLSPKAFGLGNSDELQVWEVHVLNGSWIVYAAPAGVAHGMMPVSRVVPKTEHGEEESKSIAERLIPFQDLISETYNMYSRGQRKSVNNGLIFYDSKSIKLGEHRDPTSGYIPVEQTLETAGRRMPLRDMIHTVHERPEINTSINDIAQIKDIMQDVLPTDMMSTLADMDRATNHQSQSVSNAASRRLFRLARDISAEGISPVNYMMTQNIMTFQTSMKMIDSNGQTIEISPEQFKDANLQVAVSDGLRGIDTVAISQSIQQVIQYALQSRRTHTSFDVVKMIEYMLHVQGATFDIEKFRFDTPFDGLDEEQKNAAFELLQRAQQETGEEVQST